MDDRYFVEKPVVRSLIFYLLFVMLSVTCQLPLIILSCKFFLSGLIDNLLVLYIIFLLLFVIISISLFCFLCFSPSSWWNFNYIDQYTTKLNQDDQSTSSDSLHRLVCFLISN